MFNKNKPVLVIDIGSRLTITQVWANGHIKVDALKVVDFDSGKNFDETFVASIQNFIKENNVKHKKAIVRPTLSSLFIKHLQLPAVPDKELAEAIKWQVKEDVPYNLLQSVFEYSVIKRISKEDGAKLVDVICVCAKEEEVKRWVLLTKQAGLACLAVGLLPFSYEKLKQRYINDAKDKISCILHIDNDSCYIFIYRENKLDFYRELPVSINKLRESLRGVLVSDLGKIELSPGEIEDILFRVGIPDDNFVYNNKFNATQILGMLRPVLERLAMEVKRSFIYYHSQFQTGEVSNILLTGEIMAIPKIETFLSKELSLDVKRLAIDDKIEIDSSITSKLLPKFIHCLGLALDYSQGISLLPQQFRTEKIESVEKVSIRWVAFIVFLLFSLSLLLARISIKSYERDLDNKKIYLNIISELKETKSKVDEFNGFIGELKSSEYPLAAMLKKLSNITTPELFIVDFSVDLSSRAGSMKGFVKSGGDNPSTLLAKLVNEMKGSIYFNEASILSVQRVNRNDAEVTEFDISFRLS